MALWCYGAFGAGATGACAVGPSVAAGGVSGGDGDILTSLIAPWHRGPARSMRGPCIIHELN